MKIASHFIKAALIASVAAIPTASAALRSYSATFCGPELETDNYTRRGWMFRADAEMSAICPIIRDDPTNTGLPEIFLEANHSSNADGGMSCTLWWIDEDSSSGVIRGFSDLANITSTGNVQFAWNDIGDFNGSSTPPLAMSSGGEGTMAINCLMDPQDRLHQYRVEENKFAP